MNVKEFVDNTRNIANEKTKVMAINNHKITDYVPYVNKVVLCKKIIDKTTYLGNDHSKVICDSLNRYLFFIMTLIKTYFDFELNEDAIFEDYDLLNESGMLPIAISCIGDREYEEFQMVLNMTLDDFYTNHYSTTSMLFNLKEAVLNVANGVLKGIEDGIIQEIETQVNEDGEVE